VAVTLSLLLVEPMGVFYAATAVVLGVLFVWQATKLARHTSPERALRLFTFSNTYLALLFGAIAVDTLIRSA
jgi:protoheme IX farnesyltransferase